jgi:demethylmenaquinone methyltransferase/2-methoxy-6-polyprenyl-1,4-benzoquinol methylase
MSVVGAPMRDYYERRAREYDDWWLGTGLFAGRERPGWHAEVRELTALLAALPPRRTLDVACGTAFLTRHLPGEITALDQSPTMAAIARRRLPGATVTQGDAVPLPFAADAFERLVTSHFYGHLQPRDETAAFLAEARRVAGEPIVVDAARRADTPPEQWQERRLNDGSRHRVYKRWFTGAQLAAELGGGEVLHDGDWFVVVRAARARARP